MRGLSIRLSNAVGPLLAGVVLATGGAAAALAVAGALFAVSLALLLTVRVPPWCRYPELPLPEVSWLTGCATSAGIGCSHRWSR
ncbi:hypothetical protein H0E86_16335 [Streptomyces sp. SCSIO-PteL053]|nr:hypothetical protein H0E86_16335 [Streptomyces sp. SCSIO-PteL053]